MESPLAAPEDSPTEAALRAPKLVVTCRLLGNRKDSMGCCSANGRKSSMYLYRGMVWLLLVLMILQQQFDGMKALN
jgi:hypothetical protein